MLYVDTQLNIRLLLSTIGTLKREQLVQFFSTENSCDVINKILIYLTQNSFIRYNSSEDTFSAHDATEINDIFKQGYINAFWMIAFIGSINVKQIHALSYPQQYMVTLNNGSCYVISNVSNESDAIRIRNVRDYFQTNHQKVTVDSEREAKGAIVDIAIVEDEELGKKLGQYGFDFYCILDPETHEPNYNKTQE